MFVFTLWEKAPATIIRSVLAPKALGFCDGASGSLIFPDASSYNSTFGWDELPVIAAVDILFYQSDFVDLGTIEANTSLDFFLIANGANGTNSRTNTFWTDIDTNPDGINHVVSFCYLIAIINPEFEDLYGGGDRDFNDILVVMDIGSENARALIPAMNQARLFYLPCFLPARGYIVASNNTIVARHWA